MVESKIEALPRVSATKLIRAEKRFEGNEYDYAVFHAPLVLVSAANTVIPKLGKAKDYIGDKRLNSHNQISEKGASEGREVY